VTDVWDQLVDRLRDMHRSDSERATSSHARFEVIKLSPLRLRELGGDLLLDDDDDDVEVSRAVRRAVPPLAVGDKVVVREDADGYVVTEVLDDA